MVMALLVEDETPDVKQIERYGQKEMLSIGKVKPPLFVRKSMAR